MNDQQQSRADGLNEEQREALEWAADRAHVASLGKPVVGIESRRHRALRNLLDALAEVIPEGCTPADARMLREANHALAAENDALRCALRPFARVVSTDKLSWAMVEYCVRGDPEKQTFQAPQMQRAFNRAADILRAESSQPAAAPIPEDCDVRNILLDVVPGEDGEGQEVYARNVADVERLLSEMGEKLDAAKQPAPSPVDERAAFDSEVGNIIADAATRGIAWMAFKVGARYARAASANETGAEGAKAVGSPNRPSDNPGGMECSKCGCIFIGGPEHDVCAVCAMTSDQSSELESMTRMFHAACHDLGLINEALGLDPDDGGAEPILDAIAELRAQIASAQTDEPVAWAVYNGWSRICFYMTEDAARDHAQKAQKNHDLSGSLAAFRVVPLYAAPQPAQADAPAEAREPVAWVTDDDRAITAAQKQRALADGGATASSVRPYSIPCYAVSAPADAGEARLTDAARDMLAERRRQVEAEGWTPEHDDQYQHGAIALAAACYAANAGGVAWADPLPSFWPWMHNWWKPTTPRRDLVKAGALILAELERLDRAALLNGADHDQ
ncbi:hypothetical protein [Burkholderia pseudomallei]|uniref:hypothetical protein n=1 Tax=Burkholderia pseudomallei TaxID=28450 RepID=UPI000F1431AB|nr:hypothetical protein [Burkholderia pseudomallei]CAJ2836655.1 gp38 [Burkholderia pseudomallei]VCO58467.1 gp38 [Burkholderia pseudomallei]VCO68496.1 gp38 [Burkholderia pseudomallei]VCO70639.1 gp38 [Burkholderia pseudomallei]VCO74304.1 gp38 [Burkholderia pseudomallei]